jgi:hypothetical protein
MDSSGAAEHYQIAPVIHYQSHFAGPGEVDAALQIRQQLPNRGLLVPNLHHAGAAANKFLHDRQVRAPASQTLVGDGIDRRRRKSHVNRLTVFAVLVVSFQK